MTNHNLNAARSIFGTAFLPDLFDPDLLARHAKLPLDVVLDALKTGDLAGREFEPGRWRITKRAALAWIERPATGQEVGQ